MKVFLHISLQRLGLLWSLCNILMLGLGFVSYMYMYKKEEEECHMFFLSLTLHIISVVLMTEYYLLFYLSGACCYSIKHPLFLCCSIGCSISFFPVI
jgi:hypothetical protein